MGNGPECKGDAAQAASREGWAGMKVWLRRPAAVRTQVWTQITQKVVRRHPYRSIDSRQGNALQAACPDLLLGSLGRSFTTQNFAYPGKQHLQGKWFLQKGSCRLKDTLVDDCILGVAGEVEDSRVRP